MMKTLVILAAATAALAVACGSDSNPKMIDAKVFLDGSGSGSAFKHLTVKNAPTATPWCSITVNGGAASTAAMQTVNITADGMITLTAAPESASFQLGSGMWHHTTGDTGSGEDGTVVGTTSTAMVAVTTTADKCVWVCCPFSPGGNGCPTTDQCP